MPEVLDANDDRARWLQVWSECGREPFAHPGFCQLFGGPNDRAVALVGVQPRGSWLLPLLVRPVQELSWVTTDQLDVTSPYGYGGPFHSGDVDAEQVLDDCRDWVRSSHMLSAFLRLSLDVPLQPGRSSTEIDVVHSADNVVVDLGRTQEELWMHYEHKVRKNVKKALRAGCSVRRDDTFVDLDSFVEIYEATMHRRQASSWYHFNFSFFQRVAVELEGCFSVYSVISPADEVLSVELVLESDDYLYSFLGGTRKDAFSVAPNDLLKHEAILHGQRTGRKGFVLGGGYAAGDGIFRYKRSFDPTGVVPFLTARILGRPDHYADLVAKRKEHYGADPADEEFFPSYRARHERLSPG